MTDNRNRRKRGQQSEHIAAAWFQGAGWPFAEAVGAGRPGADITGMPGLCPEVKARRDFRPVEWLNQHARAASPQNTLEVVPFVIWRPDGKGPAQIASWGVMQRLDHFTALLKAAGYGG